MPKLFIFLVNEHLTIETNLIYCLTLNHSFVKEPTHSSFSPFPILNLDIQEIPLKHRRKKKDQLH